MKKLNKRVNYEILATQFESWWLKQIDDYLNVSSGICIPPELLKRAHCSSKNEFEEKYLKYWTNLDPGTIGEILRLLTQYHFFYSRNPLTFEASHTYKMRFEGLFFLLAQVEKLQLFPVKEREELKGLYRQTEKQCIWCGQTNHDPNGDPFNGSRHACHVKGCPEIKGQSNSNPSGHAERGCCSGYWKLFANRIKQQISRDAGSTDEAWRFLIEACEALLRHNQNELKFTMQYIQDDTGKLQAGLSPDALLSPSEDLEEIQKLIKARDE